MWMISGMNLVKSFAFLVDGVTKLGRLIQVNRGFGRKSSKNVITNNWARVIIVKLADRLHNMRTINFSVKKSRLRNHKKRLIFMHR